MQETSEDNKVELVDKSLSTTERVMDKVQTNEIDILNILTATYPTTDVTCDNGCAFTGDASQDNEETNDNIEPELMQDQDKYVVQGKQVRGTATGVQCAERWTFMCCLYLAFFHHNYHLLTA